MKYKLVPVSKKDDEKKVVDNRDIRQLCLWSNEVLLQRYEETTKYVSEYEDRANKLGLFNDPEGEHIKKYRTFLKLIELLEDEGRRRKMIYFMGDQEFSDLCENLFGAKPTEMSEENKRIMKEAGENALVYRVKNGKPIVLLRKDDNK